MDATVVYIINYATIYNCAKARTLNDMSYLASPCDNPASGLGFVAAVVEVSCWGYVILLQ